MDDNNMHLFLELEKSSISTTPRGVIQHAW
jgi:hypothetical protein